MVTSEETGGEALEAEVVESDRSILVVAVSFAGIGSVVAIYELP